MKKLVSMLLALAMVLTLAGGAMAESVPFRNCAAGTGDVRLRSGRFGAEPTPGPETAGRMELKKGCNAAVAALFLCGISGLRAEFPFCVRDSPFACGVPG